MFNEKVGWAAGDDLHDGKIAVTTDGGVVWSTRLVRAARLFRGVATPGPQKVIATGYSAYVPYWGMKNQTTDGGATWNEWIPDSIKHLFRVKFVGPSHGWVPGILHLNNLPIILRTVDGGESWEVHRTPRGLWALSFVDSVHGWATTSTFTVLRTTDGGISWESLFTAQADIGTDAISFVDSTHGWIFGNEFYQGGISGVIYRTTDGGRTWAREAVGLSALLRDGEMLDRHHGWAVADDGRILSYRMISSAGETPAELPARPTLLRIFPNPFNPSTTIEYLVQSRAEVQLSVYDLRGRPIRTLAAGTREPGTYREVFDATGLAAGVYWCRLTVGSYRESRRMVFVK